MFRKLCNNPGKKGKTDPKDILKNAKIANSTISEKILKNPNKKQQIH